MLKHIGKLQRIPAEEITTDNLNKKLALYIDYSYAGSGRLGSVTILNKERDESSETPMHEISIEGDDGYESRALLEIVGALGALKSIEDEIEALMRQEAEKVQREQGVPLICVPGGLSREHTPIKRLPEYGLCIRRSRYDVQDIFFIIKGNEKEDTATEAPFKIEVDEPGDFVSVSRENIQPLIEELNILSQLPS